MATKLIDTFTRSVTDGWGLSDSGHLWVESTNEAGSADVNGTQGVFQFSTSVRNNAQTVNIGIDNFEGLLIYSFSEVTSPGRDDRIEVGSSNASIRVYTTTNDRLEMIIFNSSGSLSGGIIANPYVYPDKYYLRFLFMGSNYYARTWKTTDSEPTNWQAIGPLRDVAARDGDFSIGVTKINTSAAIMAIDSVEVTPIGKNPENLAPFRAGGASAW